MEIPYFLTWALNDIYTANSAVYGDLHAADGHVSEAAIYRMPAICNNWRRLAAWGVDWHVPVAAMSDGPGTCNHSE